MPLMKTLSGRASVVGRPFGYEKRGSRARASESRTKKGLRCSAKTSEREARAPTGTRAGLGEGVPGSGGRGMSPFSYRCPHVACLVVPPKPSGDSAPAQPVSMPRGGEGSRAAGHEEVGRKQGEAEAGELQTVSPLGTPRGV